PAFFTEIATFYCTGDFHGFGIEDLRLSPRLLAWLEHELSYGETQREITRRWLSYLSGGAVRYRGSDLQAPVALRAKWKRALLDALGALLWEKVKAGRHHGLQWIAPGEGWQSPRRQAVDFRFLNCNAFSPAALARAAAKRAGRESFEYLFAQYLSGFDRERF